MTEKYETAFYLPKGRKAEVESGGAKGEAMPDQPRELIAKRNELCEKLAIHICDISNGKEWDATLAEEHKERHRKVVREEILPIIRSYTNAQIEDLRQQSAALVSALREVRDMVFNLPSGVDENASENNCSPEDASAHIGGLIVQRINAALASYAPAEVEAKEKPCGSA